MSIAGRIKSRYKDVLAQFEVPQGANIGAYQKQPYLIFDFKSPEVYLFPKLVEQCTELYNEIDSAVETLKISVPEVYKNSLQLIEQKVIGGLNVKSEIFDFFIRKDYSTYSGIEAPGAGTLPLGIKSVIELLTKAAECRFSGLIVNSDEYYYTALASYRSLESASMQFLSRLNYVMLYPHRILLDRVILETVLKREGMERIASYVQSAEEHFNNGKYVEFCAMARNSLEETIKTVCLILDGNEHGYPNNLRRLEEIGYIKSTIAKQAKEFGGSLSACGSHPSTKCLSSDEAKFLLDSLYSFLGLFSLRLSSFRDTNSSRQE